MAPKRLCLWISLSGLVALASYAQRSLPVAHDRFWELPPAQHPLESSFEGKLAEGHPRLVFRPSSRPGLGRTFEEVRALYANDDVFRGIFTNALAVPDGRWHAAMAAACWIVTGDDAYAERAVQLMLSQPIRRSGRGYSNIWIFALAYDWLHEHPAMTPAARAAIEGKLAERLASELDGLDASYMALWHGRNQAANNTMIAALALGDAPRHRDLLRRAIAHYADSLRALQHTEAWPEGASYWIYNRAGPYVLAADAFMTAFNNETVDGIPIREVMRRVGYWHVYAFGPNEVFEPYGDSQGSLRLGETGWWALTTDYVARLSGDADLMAGADYIRNRSPNPYGRRPYYWYVALSYDPAMRPPEPYDPKQPELWMREHWPQAKLFGRESMGLAFFRGAWGAADETYATFNAGHYFAHHQHYDVGHFSIQKNGLLAPRTGLLAAGFNSTHRLGYFTQTVSANSLLVLAPGETSAYLEWRGKGEGWSALSGGQRAIRPTGFTCANTRHFQTLLDAGPHLRRAEITAFASVPGLYDYIAADITSAYNSTRYIEPGRVPKVAQVTRSFLYVRPHDAFIVYDRVETTDASYLPKFLLQHLAKPISTDERLLVGNGPDDGILETHNRLLVSEHGNGRLAHHLVYPVHARALKIGGPSYRCYVEASGTQTNGFTGVNLDPGINRGPRSPVHIGEWRTEVEPLEPGNHTRFLNVLLVRLADDPAPLPPVRGLDAGSKAQAVQVGDWALAFAYEAKPLADFELVLPEALRVLAVDAHPHRVYRIGTDQVVADGEGMLNLGLLSAGRYAVALADPTDPIPGI